MTRLRQGNYSDTVDVYEVIVVFVYEVRPTCPIGSAIN